MLKFNSTRCELYLRGASERLTARSLLRPRICSHKHLLATIMALFYGLKGLVRRLRDFVFKSQDMYYSEKIGLSFASAPR